MKNGRMLLVKVLGDTRQVITGFREMFGFASYFFPAPCRTNMEI